MSSPQKPTPLILRIQPHLPLVEKVFLIALMIGIILTLLKIDSLVLRVALLGTGVVFFLFMYRLTEIPTQENERFGFSELLAYMIVPKILWMSSAISAWGIAFYLFNFGNDGYKRMLLIGGLPIAIGTLLLIFFAASGVRHIKLVAPILFRAIPLFLVDIYLLLNKL